MSNGSIEDDNLEIKSVETKMNQREKYLNKPILPTLNTDNLNILSNSKSNKKY